MTTEYVFGELELSLGSTRLVSFDWFDKVAGFWESGKQYANGDVVRPSIPSGFAYQSGGGQSGLREPRWPKALASTVADGSVTWTAIAADSNGVTVVSSPSVDVDPSSGLAAGSPAVVDGDGTSTRVQLTLAATTEGTYEVKLTVTAGSETLVGTCRVAVAER